MVCLRLPERKTPPEASCIALKASSIQGRSREGILAGVVVWDQPVIEGHRREKLSQRGLDLSCIQTMGLIPVILAERNGT